MFSIRAPIQAELIQLANSHLDKVQIAELGCGAKLPLALGVCVVELSRELLGVLVLAHLLGLIHQTRSLGRPGEPDTTSCFNAGREQTM